MSHAQARPFRRHDPAPNAWRNAALWIVFGLSWPFIRFAKARGRWPAVLLRRMNRAMGRFGPYEPTARDVLVCSYFKSGTNWTMHIALQIAHRGRAQFEHIHDLVAWPEVPGRHGRSLAIPIGDEMPWRSSPTGLRIVKTHLPFDRIPYRPEARYLWVVRDPKDVFVSSYHFVRGTMLGTLMPSKQQWLDTFLSADAMCGPWAAHLASGWQVRDRQNVLFLTYEQLQQDLAASVSRIAHFLGVTLEEAELQAVVRQGGIEHMRGIAGKFDVRRAVPPWVKQRGRMIRRGQSGASAELLTPAEQQRIDDHCRAELARLGCDFDYDAAFTRAEARGLPSAAPTDRARPAPPRERRAPHPAPRPPALHR